MKKNIAIITGGYSSEAQISYLSAKTVLEHIDKKRYSVYVIKITIDSWFCNLDGDNFIIDKNDFSLTIKSEKIKFDLCYMMIHGTPGEDGKLQGYFDSINQKYSSCNAAVSALTFNKFHTIALLQSLGIKVAKSIILFHNQAYQIKKIIPVLRFPVFVKPNNGGSSIGISKVKKEDQLDNAIKKAFAEDTQVIVEEEIVGREFTVGLYACKNDIVILPITEIQTKNDFFDFEAKYKGKAVEITPAKITAHLKKKMENTAKDIYLKLNCGGVVRIDMIYNEKEDNVFVLEINTIPGQTSSSFIPQQVTEMKVTLKKFYTTLIEEALSKT